GINLSRNFGQHYGFTAGLDYAQGEWVVVMDCDLQDQPEEILKLYDKALEGYDIVYARRIERKDSFTKRISSKIFHTIYSYLIDIKTDSAIGNFGIFSKDVVREYNKMKETARSFPALVQYTGFKQGAVDVKHSQRLDGKSSYSLARLYHLTLDVILSGSSKPLKLVIRLGFTISFLSVLISLYNILAYFIGINQVAGFTSTIFSIWFMGGMIMLVLGILGLYIGKIFEQVKERPLYIVSDKINIDHEDNKV
ncbi:MAG: glycosyltransferase, partial [Syntrophales bacterium LBB04]|nr:glycosyltransferase [Syntrophales bacterium LBB04]